MVMVGSEMPPLRTGEGNGRNTCLFNISYAQKPQTPPLLGLTLLNLSVPRPPESTILTYFSSQPLWASLSLRAHFLSVLEFFN